MLLDLKLELYPSWVAGQMGQSFLKFGISTTCLERWVAVPVIYFAPLTCVLGAIWNLQTPRLNNAINLL